MKALFIAPIPFFYERGACIRSLNMIEAISKLGHSVDILTYPVGKDVDIPRVRIIRVKTRFRPPREAKMTLNRLLTDFALYRKALEIGRKGNYDFIVGKTPIGRIIARKVKERTGIPLMIDVVESGIKVLDMYTKKGSFGGKLSSRIARLLFLNPIVAHRIKREEYDNYTKADVILANWKLVKDSVEKETGKKCILLHDKIPEIMERRPTRNMRKTLGIKGSEKVLLYTGALASQQGIEVYMDSLKFLKHKNVKLVMVGEKNGKYVEIAKNSPFADRIIFTGKKPFSEMPDYLSTADVLLTAYCTKGKNATIKLLFYLFFGKPIVASDVPQYRQIVDNDIVFLARPTPQDFAKKIDFILDNPNKAKIRAMRALKYAKREFSKETYMKTLGDALRMVKHHSH